MQGDAEIVAFDKFSKLAINKVYKPLNKVNEGTDGTRYNSQLQHCVGH